MKKIIVASSLSLALLGSQVGSAFAAPQEVTVQADQAISQLSQAFIDKVNPYVKIDSAKQFYLTKEAEKILSKADIQTAKEVIEKTNDFVREHAQELSISSNGTLVPTQFERAAINLGDNFSFDIAWWGTQIHFSHEFVQKFKDNVLLYTASVAGTIAAMQATMLFFSVTPPAWFASAVTAVAAAGAWMLINTDKGAGTYVDFYGWYGTIGITVPVPIFHSY
ncbi:hypothetical protein [Paenibacillus elgii]|uniref:Uncharacterized protein n=1 Tax=Paenibacillus elgii TaxID=189691 RepID=A0A165QGC6_9BACL|nr:hypothetical protein [Paenibacillus elgii]KZE74872.1 hypothetical protein AV654_28415 [Paenibacillus elgii]NEN85664.1 hypothetical protein [Paenibacillus elgii]